MNQRFLTLAFISSLALTACNEDLMISPEERASASQAQNFGQLRVSDTFDWSTTQGVTLTFTATDFDERRAILHVTTTEGESIFKKMQHANEDYSIELQVPAQSTQLVVAFGMETKTLDIINSRVEMNLK